MKKAIIIALAITSSVMLNAATVNWAVSSGRLFDGNGTASTRITSGSAYLMFVTTSYTQNSLVQAFVAANGDSSATINAMTASGALATGVGQIDSDSRPSGTSTYSITADGSAYFVVFNDGKMFVSYIKDAPYDLTTGEVNIDFKDSISDASKTTINASSGYSNAGWYVVPEPTSGLLMLLGMAGLALKRKRA